MFQWCMCIRACYTLKLPHPLDTLSRPTMRGIARRCGISGRMHLCVSAGSIGTATHRSTAVRSSIACHAPRCLFSLRWPQNASLERFHQMQKQYLFAVNQAPRYRLLCLWCLCHIFVSRVLIVASPQLSPHPSAFTARPRPCVAFGDSVAPRS